MTGADFIKWLHSKQEINACSIGWKFDPGDPGKIILMDIQIVADGEVLTIPYPRLDDSEETVFTKSVSVMMVLNRLMEQYGIDCVFGFIADCNDGGIYSAEEESGRSIHNLKKGGN